MLALELSAEVFREKKDCWLGKLKTLGYLDYGKLPLSQLTEIPNRPGGTASLRVGGGWGVRCGAGEEGTVKAGVGGPRWGWGRGGLVLREKELKLTFVPGAFAILQPLLRPCWNLALAQLDSLGRDLATWQAKQRR